MQGKRMRLIAIVILCFSLSAFADLKLKTRTTVAGHSTDSVVLIKGSRQRSEMLMPGFSLVSIYQCDKDRIIQINDAQKTYMITELGGARSQEATNHAPATGRPTRKGGNVTLVTTVKDLGGRKQILGLPARQLKMDVSAQADPGACMKDMHMTTEGWYIDLAAQPNCSVGGSAMSRSAGMSGCQDNIHFKYSGNGRPGYPVDVTTTMQTERGPMTVHQQALEVDKTELKPALFEVPEGYRQVHSMQELMGMPNMAGLMGQAARQQQESQNESSGSASDEEAPQASLTRPSRPSRNAAAGESASASGGRLRVCLDKVQNTSSQEVETELLQSELRNQLEQRNAEAVDVDLTAAGDWQAANQIAQQQHCDYMLYTDVKQVKAPSVKKKLGGFLGRATGMSSGGSYQATLTFRLFAIDDQQARLESQASSDQGSSTPEAVNDAVGKEADAVMEQVQKDAELKEK